MAKHPDITLGFILEKHKKNPKDRKLHKKIEKGKIKRKVLSRFLKHVLRDK